jgi:hypothetical protein
LGAGRFVPFLFVSFFFFFLNKNGVKSFFVREEKIVFVQTVPSINDLLFSPRLHMLPSSSPSRAGFKNLRGGAVEASDDRLNLAEKSALGTWLRYVMPSRCRLDEGERVEGIVM